MRRLLFVFIVVLVVLVPEPGHAAPPVYVALGASYTAGPFIPSQLADPPGCLRSDRNYPHRLAAALGVTRVALLAHPRSLALADVTLA